MRILVRLSESMMLPSGHSWNTFKSPICTNKRLIYSVQIFSNIHISVEDIAGVCDPQTARFLVFGRITQITQRLFTYGGNVGSRMFDAYAAALTAWICTGKSYFQFDKRDSYLHTIYRFSVYAFRWIGCLLSVNVVVVLFMCIASFQTLLFGSFRSFFGITRGEADMLNDS